MKKECWWGRARGGRGGGDVGGRALWSSQPRIILPAALSSGGWGVKRRQLEPLVFTKLMSLLSKTGKPSENFRVPFKYR